MTSNILRRLQVYLKMWLAIDRPSRSLSIDVHYLFRHIEKYNPTVQSHHVVLAGERLLFRLKVGTFIIHNNVVGSALSGALI